MVPRPDVSAQRRAEILEAATSCFMRRGFTNTTMDDIVAESGLSKGTLYWYFGSKDELFMSAVASFFQGFGQQTMEALAGCETAAEQLRCGGRALIAFCREAQGLFGLFLEFWSQSERRGEASQVWAGMLQQYAHVIAGLVEEGVRRGEFRPVDAEHLVWAILAAYDGLAVYALIEPSLDLDRVSEAFVETLLSGLIVNEQNQARRGP
jgi:AcrR family transcriptional regulator